MAKKAASLTLVLGLGALTFALVAIYLQPFQNGLFFLGDHSQVEVFDASREVKYLGRLAASGVEHYQNIFYAEDTSGENRFAPPVPYQPSKGSIVDATLTGAWCPQGTGDILPFTSHVTNVSENCLSLRVARPRGTRQDARLPVMVWLHGGKANIPSFYTLL